MLNGFQKNFDFEENLDCSVDCYEEDRESANIIYTRSKFKVTKFYLMV